MKPTNPDGLPYRTDGRLFSATRSHTAVLKQRSLDERAAARREYQRLVGDHTERAKNTINREEFSTCTTKNSRKAQWHIAVLEANEGSDL